MPLFEIDEHDELIPFRQLRGGAELYEREIEDLLWDNVEEFSGESLFPVARQPRVGAGGRPDVVALDEKRSVVVVEIKRDVDRGQLAQCLEYAGWARKTSLDELARDFHGRTESATDLTPAHDYTKISGRKIRVADLLERDLVAPGDDLVWNRPRLGDRYAAKILESGSIELSDGRAFSSPSRAACEAASIPAYDGWLAWTVVRLGGKTLDDLRHDLHDRFTTIDPDA